MLFVQNLPESWKNPVGEIYIQYINKASTVFFVDCLVACLLVLGGRVREGRGGWGGGGGGGA